MKREIGARGLRRRGQGAARGAARTSGSCRPDERRDAIKQAAVPVAADRDIPADEDGVDYPDLQIEYERPDGSDRSLRTSRS